MSPELQNFSIVKANTVGLDEISYPKALRTHVSFLGPSDGGFGCFLSLRVRACRQATGNIRQVSTAASAKELLALEDKEQAKALDVEVSKNRSPNILP